MANTYDSNKSVFQNASPDQLLKFMAALMQIEGRLERNVMDSADVRDKTMLESQLKMRKGAQDFNIEMQKIDAANARARLAAAAKIESTALKSVEDYATKYAKPYSRIEDAAEARGREHATPGRSRFGTVMGVLIQRATAASGMTFDKYNPKFLRTFESVVAVADPAGEFLTIKQVKSRGSPPKARALLVCTFQATHRLRHKPSRETRLRHCGTITSHSTRRSKSRR